MPGQSQLKSFNLYRHLKRQSDHDLAVPYFLADKDTYRDAGVTFPFRSFAFGVGITYRGGGDTFRIGSADYTVAPGCLTTIGPGLISQWAGDFTAEHDTIYFTDELFTTLDRTGFLQSMSFFYPGGRHVLQLSEEQVTQTSHLFAVIKAFANQQDVMPGLVHSLLKLVQSFHAGSDTGFTLSNGERIARCFRQLLARHYPDKKDVGFYASRLHLTPKYLSEVLVAQTGRSAKVLIDDYLSMEARSLLKQTSMSVQEISYWLGYDDVSYFCKVFKKWTGLTPFVYRTV